MSATEITKRDLIAAMAKIGDGLIQRPFIVFLPPSHPVWKMHTPAELCVMLGADEVRKTVRCPTVRRRDVLYGTHAVRLRNGRLISEMG